MHDQKIAFVMEAYSQSRSVNDSYEDLDIERLHDNIRNDIEFLSQNMNFTKIVMDPIETIYKFRLGSHQ